MRASENSLFEKKSDKDIHTYKGHFFLFINSKLCSAFCWGDKRKRLKPTLLLLGSWSAPWPWSLSSECFFEDLAHSRCFTNVYLMTSKETERFCKTRICSIIRLKWKWGKRLNANEISEFSVHLVSHFCLCSISIDIWKLTAFNFRFINWYAIYFSWKISVVWLLIKLIYSINFKTFDSFLSYKLVLSFWMVQINYPCKTTGKLKVKLNVRKISIHGTQFSRDVGFMKWKWLFQSAV